MKSKLKSLINCHFQLYPKMQIEDLYKLIYQSVMGPGHLLEDEAVAFRSLKNEMEKSSGKAKNLFIDIGLDNDLVRVNLNAFQEKIGDAQKLFSAIKETAKIIKPDKSKLRKVWVQVGQIFSGGEPHFLSYSTWKEFTEFLQKNSFPHIPHSEIYRKAYLPSYRIVLRKFLINMSIEV
ncbi:MAG: hypothetical protein U9R23_02000 [Candidatus Cloacimonadota bacterium]|nr:hypothetical protein [Candidatus Cloacimonadota bacterium]